MAQMNDFLQHARENEEFHLMAVEETKDNLGNQLDAIKCNCEANLNYQQQRQFSNFNSFESTPFNHAWSICSCVTTVILVLLMCIWIMFEFREADV